MVVNASCTAPWYANYANYIVAKCIPPSFTYQQKKKFFFSSSIISLSIVFACDKFRPYIVDSRVPIHTNHAAIKYLMENKD